MGRASVTRPFASMIREFGGAGVKPKVPKSCFPLLNWKVGLLSYGNSAHLNI